jgi:hypothetical protein
MKLEELMTMPCMKTVFEFVGGQGNGGDCDIRMYGTGTNKYVFTFKDGSVLKVEDDDIFKFFIGNVTLRNEQSGWYYSDISPEHRYRFDLELLYYDTEGEEARAFSDCINVDVQWKEPISFHPIVQDIVKEAEERMVKRDSPYPIVWSSSDDTYSEYIHKLHWKEKEEDSEEGD